MEREDVKDIHVSTVHHLEGQVTDLRYQLGVAQGRIGELTATLGRLTNQLEAAQKRNQDLLADLEYNERAMAEAQRKNRDLNYEVIQLRKQVGGRG